MQVVEVRAKTGNRAGIYAYSATKAVARVLCQNLTESKLMGAKAGHSYWQFFPTVKFFL